MDDITEPLSASHAPPEYQEGDTSDTFGRSDSFPGFTKGRQGKVCCCDIYSIPGIDASFIGHWEVQMTVPCIVIALMLSSFIVFICFGVPNLSVVEAAIVSCVLFVFLFMFAYSYVRIIVEGPGYFPFYWSLSEEEIPPEVTVGDLSGFAGIAANDEQITWLQSRRRPPRSVFARTARRFVLRPDHLCGWTATWIGQMNYKFFMLFNMYGVLYCGLYTCEIIRIVVSMLLDRQYHLQLIALGSYCLIAGSFLVMTCLFFATSVSNATRNATQWEQWNGISDTAFDQGSVLSNLEGVMGSGSRCAWMCPTTPFPDASVSSLASRYITYDDA